MHRIRTGAVIVATATLAAALGTAQTAAATPSPDGGNRPHFTKVTPATVSTAHVRGLSSKPVTVMVQLSGDPITVAEAKATGKLSKAEKEQIRQNLRSSQGQVAAQIRKMGGAVGASYQAAYNGMKVTIAGGKLAELGGISGVSGVHALTPKAISNIHGVPLVGAPQVWAGVAGVNGMAGEGIKIADIDTGIDYTHADFGGPGTAEAYQQALASDTAAANPAWFGPDAPRVKGGIDLVGDDYNADPEAGDAYQPVPHPDPNPLDCNNHGTHTAGTAAGSGVLADGSTYTGAYTADTVSSNNWKVGPGVAPKADIYAVRVFGCQGSTDVVVDAIEWAVDHGMDVINMSLGSPYGGPDDPDAVASNNAAAAGVIVVASAGNSGPNPYIDGSPATATGAISVAASDPTASFPGVDLALSTGTHVPAIDANGIPVNSLVAPVKVLYTGTPQDAAHISLGCDPAEYKNADVAGAIVVVKRGTCARVARAIYGQQAGAAAVIMVNTSNDFPPYEGQITENPDTGEPFTVTIPFLGVKSGSAGALVAADGGSATATDTTMPNPGYLATASFSSGGARGGDSALKPDITAPGVSIASAGMGTGTDPIVESGTSMAAPHTTGAAALVRQAHPSWGAVKYWKAALVNTADAGLVAGYTTRINGSGFLQVQRAVQTQVVALGTDNTATLSYGFAEMNSDYAKSAQVTLQNFGNSAVAFTVGHSRDSGSPHTLGLPASVEVPARGFAKVSVTLQVPAKTAGDSAAFHDVAGLVTFTPAGGANNGVALSVPYYLVPQAMSKINTAISTTALLKKGNGTANVSNGGVITGAADWYALGITDGNDHLGSHDVRAVGVQTFPGAGQLAFGISTYNRWSNAAADEFDVYLDIDGDRDPDYAVVAADFGALTSGSADGRTATAVFNLHSGSGSIRYLADAPFNSTTMALPVDFSQLCGRGAPCLSTANPRFTYTVEAYGPDGSVDTTGSASFNAFTPAVSTGMYDKVAPGKTVTQPVTVNQAEFARTPAKGLMVISHDNPAATEAQLLGF